ncbi:MAG: bifunctional folylpolyglutamate synthase/dihydrofolate synthase [Rubrimonas sp.]|uniref:bifunctional folylpolyglutamate synthase/dihydrofolate synthase n=1 Tax=Rubrimonas sp. TaxID=2036015 RepID=UPI002FDD57BF
MSAAPERRNGDPDAILARLLTLHPKVIDLTLGRMTALLGKLGNPERACPPAIHIAGTNGKGSTHAMLRAGLEGAGARVHAYTSPHLARFHERIRLAGRLIDDAALSALLEECEAVNAGAQITFFEITTAAAFLAFARIPADWLVLEVGLGGRLDATNVIDRPALCVITPVSYDHQQFLGATLAEIAFEKAGILKPGVPCVVGPQTDEALAVIEAQAARVGAPLIVSGRDWEARAEGGRLVFRDEAGLLDLPLPNLQGAHQIENAGAAIAALRALGFEEAACAAAVTRAEWPARLQTLRTGPLPEIARSAGAALILDGGHNLAAGQVISRHFETLAARAPAPLSLVVGMLETKDAEGYLRCFAPLGPRVWTVDIPGAQAGLPAAALAEAGRRGGLQAQAAPGIAEAVRAACADVGPGGRALICGSLYLAGAILRENG